MTATAHVALVVDNTGTQKQRSKRNTPSQSFLTDQHPIYGGKDRFHPTQKSLLLFEELVKKHSNENDIVLDCFLGSGTTALTAKNTNRKFIGCELDQNFFEKSVNRLEGQKEYAKISER